MTALSLRRKIVLVHNITRIPEKKLISFLSTFSLPRASMKSVKLRVSFCAHLRIYERMVRANYEKKIGRF